MSGIARSPVDGTPAHRTAGPACAHCGLPLLGRSPREDAESFCCSGCFLAHRLGGRGLEGQPDRLLARVVVGAFLALGVMVFSLSLYAPLIHGEIAGGGGESAAEALRGVFRLGALALCVPVVLLLGAPLLDAVVRLRRWLSAESLVLAGTGAAFAASAWSTFRGGGEVYFDTCAVVLVLFSLGRWLDARARERATEELRRIAPGREPPASRVTRADEHAVETAVEVGKLCAGDLVRVRPGELVPVDGLVLAGRSFADTSALTGEEEPRRIAPGQRVAAGVRLVDGTLVVRAEAVAGARLRDQIERLLAEALRSRGAWVRLADRLAGALLPVALLVAAATALVRWRASGPERALLDALSVVLIACPCALGIATPLAYWRALAVAWKRGVLVRGGEVLERLARVKRACFDKTGTLTSGELELTCVRPLGAVDATRALELAAALEAGSEHPIARALRRERGLKALAVREFQALPGIGVQGEIDGVRHALLRPGPECGALPEHGAAESEDTRVLLVRGAGEMLAELRFRSEPRPESRRVLDALARRGLELRVLTGDGRGPARALERQLGIQVESELSPADKLARLRQAGRGTMFVGDGLNDAAALAAADVGVSMAHGSAASLDAAQVNLLRPGLDALPELLDLARAAVLTARLNLLWAFGYNAIGLFLAANGRLTPVFAASAMVVSSAFSVLNSHAGPLRARADALERKPARELANAPAFE